MSAHDMVLLGLSATLEKTTVPAREHLARHSAEPGGEEMLSVTLQRLAAYPLPALHREWGRARPSWGQAALSPPLRELLLSPL